jgi:hypothetical protein
MTGVFAALLWFAVLFPNFGVPCVSAQRGSSPGFIQSFVVDYSLLEPSLLYFQL